MSTPSKGRALPPRPSLEHLKKEAKRRLDALRASAPKAKLAEAQLLVARDYGFTSWRALKGKLLPRSNAEGDWICSPPLGRVALHVRADAAGGFSATVDGPDQGQFGITAQNLMISEDHIAFDLLHPMRRTHFDAVWNAAQAQWVGEFRFGAEPAGPMKAAFSRGVFAPAPVVDGLDGMWCGRIGSETGPRLIITLRTTVHGTHGWVQSPDRNPQPYPVKSVTRDGQNVVFQMMTTRFEGRLGEVGGALGGRLFRDGESWPVILRREPLEPVAPPPPAVELGPDALRSFEGVYQFHDERRLVVRLQGRSLTSLAEDGHVMPMIPVGDHEFAWPAFDGRARFESGVLVLVNDTGNVMRAEKVAA